MSKYCFKGICEASSRSDTSDSKQLSNQQERIFLAINEPMNVSHPSHSRFGKTETPTNTLF
ncbi:hypothetical protein BT69DRAFT_1283679 [Atractiella rhizophila]|nr:hypothetical protein BT69DRAFT_1283679 [Atractiella rhizophila]